MYSKTTTSIGRGVLLAYTALAALLAAGVAEAVEVEVKNDSIVNGSTAAIQAGFVANEEAAAWLTSPCTGTIVAVRVFWRSLSGNTLPSLEESISVYTSGTFPVPTGPATVLEGPVMTDGVLNEFRFLDENNTMPLSVPVTNGQIFIVSFKFANSPNPASGPSVVTDANGCQPGRNGIFAIPPSIWFNGCALGISGDFMIRAMVNCPDPSGACCVPSGACAADVTSSQCIAMSGIYQGNNSLCGSVNCPQPKEACCFSRTSCVDLTAGDCDLAGGVAQGFLSDCGSVICFPSGACCNPDGSCDNDIGESDCVRSGSVFQGDSTTCPMVSCPQPDGACCLSNGNCLSVGQTQCGGIPSAFWAGPLTACTDADMNGEADACEGCIDDSQCDDSELCSLDRCATGACVNDPISYADVNGDGFVNVGDALCELDTFAGIPDSSACFNAALGGQVSFEAKDIAPCPSAGDPNNMGDGFINVSEVLAALDVFAGLAQACNCGP